MSTPIRWNLVIALAVALWGAAAFRPALSAQQGGGVPNAQSDEEVARKSSGCLTCHLPDSKTMHASKTQIGCTDCHGGDATAMRDEAMARDSSGFAGVKARAHVAPTLPIWKTSANP